MDTFICVLLGVVGLLGATLAKILADEFKAWAPALANAILRWSVSQLPKDRRDRFREEWAAHIAEVPGDLSRVITAARMFVAARRIARCADTSCPDLQSACMRVGMHWGRYEFWQQLEYEGSGRLRKRWYLRKISDSTPVPLNFWAASMLSRDGDLDQAAVCWDSFSRKLVGRAIIIRSGRTFHVDSRVPSNWLVSAREVSSFPSDLVKIADDQAREMTNSIPSIDGSSDRAGE